MMNGNNGYSVCIHYSVRLMKHDSGSESGSKKKTRPELPFLTGFALAPESSIPVAGSNVMNRKLRDYLGL